MRKYGLLLFQFIIVLGLVLSGCLKGEQSLKEIDVPEEVFDVDDDDDGDDGDDGDDDEGDVDDEGEPDAENDTDSNEAVPSETVDRQLYLIDADGMVVPQTLPLPQAESKAVAMQVLSYLIKDGPVTELLPNGFQAVIPAGTEILGLNLLEDGTLIVDVSAAFTQYEANEELNIIEAMTFTLTQFENVERIKLRIEGEDQAEMPVDGTPIAAGYSQQNGINIHLDEKPDLQHSKVVTMYYPKRRNSTDYFVPVTQYLNDKDDDVYTLMVQALLDGPGLHMQTLDVFNDHTALLKEPKLTNGVLQLEFSEHILKDETEAIIADEVIETLARSFSGQDSIDAIEVKVENNPTIKDEHGNEYVKPVSTKSSKEKMKM